MQHDEMIGQVQALAQLPDRGSAERTARAVLRTLAERVPPGLAGHVAAQLPQPLAGSLTTAADAAEREGAPPEHGEPFGLTVFTGRVAARAGTDEDAAVRRSAAVLEVLDAAVSPEVMEKLAAELPQDVRQLLPVERARDAEG
ncbi:DUF2267 domain-containing protein [Streptomyces sp. TRM 70351]|uniref:DUF2267 domain-containing protein n=1 Tax=Streptomyces sp. TRM 70351 TaxID=3116552 RepID=UPI002E7B36B2|nr:DUF2267 domain-containing protein [Streptomyces sp. TRM 70351]MEE1926807.1 DUF2267 domain-containing protein [Streptomyces sp. TRM 70351]